MASEIVGAVHSIRVLMDVLKANKTLTNYNELVSAVSEVNADLLSAQATAITSQKSEMALAKRVSELEQKIVELEDWNREAERYELTEIAPGVFAHCLKPGMERGEPPHKLCTRCYDDHKKGVLQSDNSDGSMNRTTLSCLRCVGDIVIRHPITEKGGVVSVRPRRGWREEPGY